ncbi:MAG: iron-sulfur cluster assembly scaffold protein, partial [Gaiellales bacterium]
MYSPQVTRYALDVERAGSAGHGAASGQAGSPTCGDTVRIELVPEGGVIARARFRAFGCPHATAAAALACELAEGRGPLEAALIGAGELERRLGSAPAGHGCVSLAADALHGALARTLDRCSPPSDPARVAVAMSGGVDSAVALLKAVRSGLRPVGVTLRLWIDPQAPDTARACCSPESVRSARSTCHALGVPHITLDLQEEFRSDVVERFIGEYAAGRTPNPCVRCNGAFRFAALAAFADQVGAARIATGHYARIVRRGGRALVARAA